MDKMINSMDDVTSIINSELSQLQCISKALSEKKGDNSRWKRMMFSFIYIVGMISCIYFAVLYRKISLAPLSEQMGGIIVVIAGVSSASFFGILLLWNCMEAKYYRTIFRNEIIVSRAEKHLQKSKNICKDSYKLLNGKEKSTNCPLEVGEDCDLIIASVTKQISLLEKTKGTLIEGLLTGVYYIAALAVGAVLVLLIQNEIPPIFMSMAETNSDRVIARDVIPVICVVCAGISILGGPILAKLYFSKIKLFELKDSLVFLIAFSGFACFIAVILVLALIAVIIYVIASIISFIFGIVAVVVIIGIILVIIAGALGGG